MNLPEKWKPETLEEALLYQKITSWNEDKLVLDNGTKITIEMTDSDCCASAGGTFSVEPDGLDAVITNVEWGEPETTRSDSEWADGEYETTVLVTIYHNQNPIAQADLYANAGNGGYYYSVASFVVRTVDGHGFTEFGVMS